MFYKLYVNTLLYNYSYKVMLDNIYYTIEIKYNVRNDRYYLSLLDNTNNYIVQGCKITTGRDILHQYHHKYMCPKGSLFALSTDYKIEAVNRQNFGVTVNLYYGE